MRNSSDHILWENDKFIVRTPVNPHIPYSEGLHIIVVPKQDIASAWQDVVLTGKTFTLAAKACRIMEDLRLAPWFNIQANGNWGLLPDYKPFFHVHIYGRNKTDTWAKPIALPEAPGTYANNPMPETDRAVLVQAFKAALT